MKDSRVPEPPQLEAEKHSKSNKNLFENPFLLGYNFERLGVRILGDLGDPSTGENEVFA